MIISVGTRSYVQSSNARGRDANRPCFEPQTLLFFFFFFVNEIFCASFATWLALCSSVVCGNNIKASCTGPEKVLAGEDA